MDSGKRSSISWRTASMMIWSPRLVEAAAVSSSAIVPVDGAEAWARRQYCAIGSGTIRAAGLDVHEPVALERRDGA